MSAIMKLQPVKGMTLAEVQAEAKMFRTIAAGMTWQDGQAYLAMAVQIDAHAARLIPHGEPGHAAGQSAGYVYCQECADQANAALLATFGRMP